METFLIEYLHDLPTVAGKLVHLLRQRSVWRFDGEMGAGKTTLIQAICSEMGVRATVQSPTFSIVNEYDTPDGGVIYHFDCYRLESLEEALNIGLEEYLYAGHLCFIEWASRIEPLLPESIGVVEIQEIEDQKRKITVYLR